MTDLLIVNPPTDNPYPKRAIEPPIWCAYLAAHLKDRNPRILDCQEMSEAETRQALKLRPAIFMAMGSNPSASSTPKMPTIERLRKVEDMVAGLHPQAVGHRHLVRLPAPGRLVKLTPDWQDTDFTKYRAHNWHTLGQDPSGYGVIYTSFGCPYDCYYCNVKALYTGRRVYYRDPTEVIKEVDFMVSKGLKHLKIADELFTTNPAHVESICKALGPYKLNIWAYARVGTVSQSLLHTMKKAGINWLAYGFETASPEVRRNISKSVSDEQTFHAIRMTREAGINIIGNFMFGLPGETPETMQGTVDWAEEQNFEYVNYYLAMPYPGSEWYKDSDLDFSKWEDFSQFSHRKYADPDVARFRDQAFMHYFQRPEYLAMIEEKFGAREEILDMLDPTRERDILEEDG